MAGQVWAGVCLLCHCERESDRLLIRVNDNNNDNDNDDNDDTTFFYHMVT